MCLQVYYFSQINAVFPKHLFRFRCCQSLCISVTTDLLEPVCLICHHLPQLSLSKDYFYFAEQELLVYSGWGPAVGADAELRVKPESAEGPDRGSSHKHRLAAGFSADRGSTGSC